MEQSVFILKPEGVEKKREIYALIQMARLTIVRSANVTMPESALVELYPDIARKQNALWTETLEHMRGQVCHIGIVEGEDAIRKLVELCGENTNPRLCRHESIRRRFVTRMPRYTEDGVYYRNVIHRSQNPAEVERDLRIARMLVAFEAPVPV